MGRARKDLGDRGEGLAVAFFEERGYRVVERNYRRRHGEVDLVLQFHDTLVFCEVKTSRLGCAAESWTARQQARTCAVASEYVQRRRWTGAVRIDLLALDHDPQSRSWRIQHFENIHEASG